MHGALLLVFIFNFTFIFINVFIEKKCADLQLWGLGVNLSFQFFFKISFFINATWKKYVVTCLGKHGDLDLPRYKNELVKFNLNDTCIITWLYVYLVVWEFHEFRNTTLWEDSILMGTHHIVMQIIHKIYCSN